MKFFCQCVYVEMEVEGEMHSFSSKSVLNIIHFTVFLSFSTSCGGSLLQWLEEGLLLLEGLWQLGICMPSSSAL